MDGSRVHYDAVRRALENGNAAIMVGAGFSRNAENGDQLATWYEVAKELWRELNPDKGELKEFSTSMVAQLGEQYARVFSKPALEDLLKRLIPDDRVSPGVLHKKLLTLQWSEVFTTNYDTLLERASENIVDHAHYVVACREDIPQSKMLNRRRIVKLHGSFPSQRPFIFTEEDYRRYPDQSAPFVNLVRQSILENIFCLIGFSGDDPNFLHWIGWVRDVLDQHALPIYLFLGSAPTLGQQRLLEARRVTPVVLPMMEGVEESDYAARYGELLRILKEPLNADQKSWGEFTNNLTQPTGVSITNDEKMDYVLRSYLSLQKARSSYPAWFVAPRDVRRKFSSSVSRISRYLYSKELQDHIVKIIPHVGVAIMADYAWHNEVLLQCFDDGLAEFSIKLLSETEDAAYQEAVSEHKDLSEFSVSSQSSFNERWKEVALSLVRWARQELRQEEYESLCKKLLSKFPGDLHLQDELIYEDVLLALYKGDRDVAQNILMSWEVRSPDGYMYVRKGMLLGEVGDVSVGLTTSLMGLKKIRKNQRSRTSSVHYLSQEAWACLTVGYLQKTLTWSRSFRAKGRELEFEINPDELNQRLADLAAIDHDVVQELQYLMADLNAETPSPSQPISRTPLFELGNYSTTRHIGRPSTFDRKIDAAFAWLTLSDRVSLVPRVGDTTFDIGSFGQAAWWVQYVDSMERVLSVMIRTLNKKMLEPRSDNKLMHSAGWLSRYQVARVKEDLAKSICQRSLSLVERFFENAHDDEDELTRVAVFHLELVGRLIIRLADSELVYLFGERIVALHHSKVVGRHSEVWKSLAVCMARCFENLDLIDRGRLARSIATIPSVIHDESIRSVYRNSWVMFHNIKKRSDDLKVDNVSVEVRRDVDELILVLKDVLGNSAGPHSSMTGVWQRLFWLRDWGFINESQIQEVSALLSIQAGWPIIPGHHFFAPLLWVSNLKKAGDLSFRKWLLKQKVKPFRVTSEDEKIKSDGRFSWQLDVDDLFFVNVSVSMERSKWPRRDFVKCLLVVKEWWDDEWSLITKNIERVNELIGMTVGRLVGLDVIVARFIDDHGYESFIKSEVFSWVSTVRAESSTVGAEFLHTRIATGFSQLKSDDLKDVEKELVAGLLCADVSRANRAIAVIWYWIKHPESSKLSPPVALVTTIVAIVSTRRMPVLSRVMDLMAELVVRHPRWLCDSSYTMLANGLNMMLGELRYESRPDGTGIPDEIVPELRLGCIRLAKALKATSYDEIKAVVGLWVGQACSDPLPELRYFNE
ncbi:SIR2 family protein [Pseudomonas sp. PDM02]|uniref:SIR2 family NAD-dependent protein deacylase n=1 Tax=Pseudomonas sp. PDM02 TaxID=2769267 RepID=UPI0017836BFC|nr:SIR2 family protein [Pseudomonas sp. PDM02]MBD9612226.1 SIR2 family protein [Pseudomonas sp. PDM02]